MAATVTIQEHNTSTPGTLTDKTGGTVRCKMADDSTVDSTFPMPKPVTGVTRSFEKWLRLRIGATPPTGAISNPRFYASGTAANLTVYCRTPSPSQSYVAPVQAPNDTGDDITSFTGLAPKSLGAVAAQTADTDIGDFLVIWTTITSSISAPQAPSPTFTLTFAYDET